MKLLNSLIFYGTLSDENFDNLKLWFTQGIEELAAGKGGQLISASGAGQSFGYSTDPSMSISTWVSVLERAITAINNGNTKVVKKICVRF